MRRIALIGVAASLLLAAAAQANQPEIVQIHNRTTPNLAVTAHVRRTTVHREVSPHSYLILHEVDGGTCVRVHFASDQETHNHCRGTGTPVHLACDLPAEFLCLVRDNAKKDLVVDVQHFPRH
jgi:hypothetical protein